VSFLVNGTPIAQPRHRASCRGGYARLYLPKDHAVHAWKDAIGKRAFDVIDNAFEGPVRVDLLFGFKAKRKIDIGQYRVCKPDSDNLAKAALDALTDAGAWNDDAQVAQLHVAKVYAKDPFVQIRIEPLQFHAVASS
jgi:Holliday junction resolvase RusA-like endonuclease